MALFIKGATHNKCVKYAHFVCRIAYSLRSQSTVYAGRYILMRYILILLVILYPASIFACQDRSPRNMVQTCPKCKKWTEEELLNNELEYASAIALVSVTHKITEIRETNSGNKYEVPLSIAKVHKGWKGLVEENVKLIESYMGRCAGTGFAFVEEGEKLLILFKKGINKHQAYKSFKLNHKSAPILLKLLGNPKYVYINGTPKENRI